MPFSTDSYNLRQLALGVLYINLGRAAPRFPSTTAAHPSYKVFVDLTPPVGLLDASHRGFFPFQVRWDLWEKVVVPVVEEGDVLVKRAARSSLRNEMTREWVLISQHGTLLASIEEALRVKMVAGGYMPADDASGVEAPEVAEVVEPGTNDGSPYTRFD